MNPKYRVVSIIARGALLACAWAAGAALAAPSAATAAAGGPPTTTAPATPASGTTAAPDVAPAAGVAPADNFKTLDQEVQGLKKDVIDLNKDLFVLEGNCCFPPTPRLPCTCPWTWARFSLWIR